MSHIDRIQSTANHRRAARTQAVAAPSHANWLNGGLAIAALALLLYYVVAVNFLAAHTWNMQSANDRFSQIREEHNALVAQQASLDDRQSLAELAQQQGLVPAGSVVYLVQDHAVAAR